MQQNKLIKSAQQVFSFVLGLAGLVLVIYGVWLGLKWLYAAAVPFTPQKLAMFSLYLVGVPFAISVLLFLTTKNAANTVIPYLTIFVLPFAALGLLIAGIWYLLA